MNEFGLIPENLIQAATLAWREGRLSFRCTDGQGRSCNGGKSDPLAIGEWSEAKEPKLCRSGWHLTTAPHRWDGTRVFLCEGEDCGGKEEDKSVWRRIRPLAECDPMKVQNASVLVRCKLNLFCVDLQDADLRGAFLWCSNLQGANLQGANLLVANLQGADFRDADFRGADLRSADLRGADLRGADLFGADLRYADFRDAILPENFVVDTAE